MNSRLACLLAFVLLINGGTQARPKAPAPPDSDDSGPTSIEIIEPKIGVLPRDVPLAVKGGDLTAAGHLEDLRIHNRFKREMSICKGC